MLSNQSSEFEFGVWVCSKVQCLVYEAELKVWKVRSSVILKFEMFEFRNFQA